MVKDQGGASEGQLRGAEPYRTDGNTPLCSFAHALHKYSNTVDGRSISLEVGWHSANTAQAKKCDFPGDHLAPLLP